MLCHYYFIYVAMQGGKVKEKMLQKNYPTGDGLQCHEKMFALLHIFFVAFLKVSDYLTNFNIKDNPSKKNNHKTKTVLKIAILFVKGKSYINPPV